MRFSPAVEAAFLKSRHSMICSNISVLALLAALPLSFDLIVTALQWSDGIYFRVRCVADCAIVAFALLCVVLPRLKCVQQRMSFVAMETLAVVAVLWLILHQVMFQVAVMKSFWGRQPGAQEALQDSKRHVLIVTLGLDAVLTCSHLALPVRWFVMVWLDLAFVVFHSFFAVVAFSSLAEGLDFDDVYVIAVVFPLLTAGASYGLRTVESRDRALFTTIAGERTLRAQAEFNADARAQAGPASSEKRSLSARSTNLSSDAGSLFAAAAGGDSCEALVDLGVKEQWLIATHELEEAQDHVLGEGACGTVVAGTFCSSLVAIKRYDSYDSGRSESVFHELRIIRRIRHPNIVTFYGACIDPSSFNLKLVLELVSGTILSRFLVQVEAWRAGSPNREQQLDIMRGVCKAFIYLHSRKPCIVHADLKPENIMVEKRNLKAYPRLLDFGLAKRVTRHSRQTGGTARYVAPEVVLQEQETPSSAADVYSLGLVHFYVSSGRKPFAALQAGKIIKLIRARQLPALAWQPSPALLKMHRPLIEECTALAPASRPTVKQVFDQLAAAHGPELPQASEGASTASDAAPPEGGSMASDAALPAIEEAPRVVLAL